MSDSLAPLPVVLRCAAQLLPRVRYVFDTLLMAAGIPVVYTAQPPSEGPWLLYGTKLDIGPASARCSAILHSPRSWRLFEQPREVETVATVTGLVTVLPHVADEFDQGPQIPFDLVANAFYFLTSWAERGNRAERSGRSLYRDSIYARLGVPQDVVDQYLARIVQHLDALCRKLGRMPWPPRTWPNQKEYCVVLSHDVDFLPCRAGDTLKQGVKSVLRHLVHHRDPFDAALAAKGFARSLLSGRDPYGCVPEIISREKALGVRSSFQIAVSRRHPNDVNYRIENDTTRDYLRTIIDQEFDLCLHGSYRSTERSDWYQEEVALLTSRLCKPLGSRQHFLSFHYDALFSAQERSGIEYDMSMGFPDRPGPRAGFSYPYFPFSIEENRPYRVLQVSLFLMDVTLRSYQRLKGEIAWQAAQDTLEDLRRKRGCASIVWHPIVFGAARDPGYGDLYWRIVEHIQRSGGLATDGRSINAFWRNEARGYASFS